MQLKTVTLASAIFAATSAIETHGGYQYETRFSPDASPETNDIKDSYETAAAQQAYARLQEQIKATGIAQQCLTESEGTQPAALYALKDCIVADNKDNFFGLLAGDIEESKAFWGQVVQESTTDRTQWVPARAVSDTLSYSRGCHGPKRPASSTLSSILAYIPNSSTIVDKMLLQR